MSASPPRLRCRRRRTRMGPSTSGGRSTWSPVCSATRTAHCFIIKVVILPKVSQSPCIRFCALRSLPWRSGSQTVELSTTRTVCRLASNRQSVPRLIDSEISAIVSTLTLASRMAVFGRPMCPLAFYVVCLYLYPISNDIFCMNSYLTETARS